MKSLNSIETTFVKDKNRFATISFWEAFCISIKISPLCTFGGKLQTLIYVSIVGFAFDIVFIFT